ncbi:DedA family protein [Halorhodospira halochloris]|uniref:VTT domain-containing protein n=1 Tax=Halorhodospira halochloris TaxID=1052 RepID=A0A0X8X7F8_HALHR|nr:DedA family protein [Halorhodospira halochloris]MBK1652905.1 alkaline phosphatase [Halorhodospira halochloris]MCG5531409.1 DedA family protein [Halorhodospira halochloris]MCG5549117.1 DedA family protein [Halorhodospira halochloris]BAU56984.1 hypothetical protein HH1059_03050 [Halorhodospira halochloris]
MAAEIIIEILEHLGLIGIFIAMIFIAPETLMPFLGYAASQGDYHPLAALAAASLGSTFGSTLIYYAARWLDRERMIWWLTLGGRWYLFKRSDIAAMDKVFSRHGALIVFFGRFLPTVRSVVSVPAGLLPMPMPKFLLFTFLGSTAWNSLLVLGGYTAGANWERMVEYLGTFGTLITFAFIALIIGFVLFRLRTLTLGK